MTETQQFNPKLKSPYDIFFQLFPTFWLENLLTDFSFLRLSGRFWGCKEIFLLDKEKTTLTVQTDLKLEKQIKNIKIQRFYFVVQKYFSTFASFKLSAVSSSEPQPASTPVSIITRQRDNHFLFIIFLIPSYIQGFFFEKSFLYTIQYLYNIFSVILKVFPIKS